MLIKAYMLNVQIAQQMQASIQQFLFAGDPYYTSPSQHPGVLNISRFTIGLYELATKLIH